VRDVDALAGDEGVKDVLWGALELHSKKSLDYGLGKDLLANVRAAEEFAVPAWVGTVIRMNDKVTRIKSFLQKGTLANESLEDSLADIVVYAAIALRLYREQSDKGAPKA